MLLSIELDIVDSGSFQETTSYQTAGELSFADTITSVFHSITPSPRAKQSKPGDMGPIFC